MASQAPSAAGALSVPFVPAAESGAALFAVIFNVGAIQLALPMSDVIEIDRPTTLTPFAEPHPLVEGRISLRDHVLPVIDLRRRVGAGGSGGCGGMTDTRLIVVDASSRPVALIVDRVLEVVRLDTARIAPAPSFAAGVPRDWLAGVATWANRPLLLLDADRLFTPDELRAIDAAMR